MAKKPETKFREKTVLPFLKTLPNTEFFAIQQVAIKGDPDYFLCINGLFIALELKAEKGKIRKLQQYKLDRVTNNGRGKAFVANPQTWGGVAKCLSELAGVKHDSGVAHD